MKNESFIVSLSKNPTIKMNVTPGHFTTRHFHVSHYLDLNDLKTNASVAKDVAIELALPYLTTTLVDTIVCMEGTEVIGAYMAQELLNQGTSVVNKGREINVVTPMSSVDRKLIFQSNMEGLINDRNVIVLISSISSGTTLRSALESISYYGGRLVGISALFNAYPDRFEEEINFMFTSQDILNYQVFKASNCDMCREGSALEAIIIKDGYTKIDDDKEKT